MAVRRVALTTNALGQVIALLRIGQPLPDPPGLARVHLIKKELSADSAAVEYKAGGLDKQADADQDRGVQGDGP